MAELAVPKTEAVRKRPFLNQRRREALTGYLFASPWLFGFLALTLGPMLFSLYVSFTSYDIANPPHWIGLQNYQFIFQHDSDFTKALGNTLWYVTFKTPVVIVTSLFLAILMNQKVPGIKYYRTIFYMPTVITGVAAIFLWVWLLSPFGLVNNILGALHLPQQEWFLNPQYAKTGMIIMGTWYIGAPMLILLAGLNSIPRHLYEAAMIDGAGILRRFWNITLPMLSPTLFFIILTNVIGAFQVFNSAYVISTTAGGAGAQPGDPEKSLLFYEVYLYKYFGLSQMGYASALAWILFIVVLAITATQLYLSRRWVYYEGG
ncbi:MAG TPA: sugar ABC transporter permease [Chloroflexota bacterium]|nr:sugar ABC transporter permease [Chloroflexota bacterium]